MAADLFDRLSRTLCPELKTFVMFSSFVAGHGNRGQANYSYASSVSITRTLLKTDTQGSGVREISCLNLLTSGQ